MRIVTGEKKILTGNARGGAISKRCHTGKNRVPIKLAGVLIEIFLQISKRFSWSTDGSGAKACSLDEDRCLPDERESDVNDRAHLIPLRHHRRGKCLRWRSTRQVNLGILRIRGPLLQIGFFQEGRVRFWRDFERTRHFDSLQFYLCTFWPSR